MDLRSACSWILAGILAGSVLATAPAARGQNLLANPSFEQAVLRGDTRVPAGWDAWAYPGTTLAHTDQTARTGTGAGSITVTAAGADAFPLFCQRLDVEAGERYRARIWVRTAAVASSWGPQLNFEFFDAAGTRLPFVEGGQAGGGTHDWVELTADAYVPGKAVQLMFTAHLHGEGQAWFDDAELIKVSDPDAFHGAHVTVEVRPDQVLNPEFLGFGCHGDNFLAAPFNTSRGVTAADEQLVRERVAAMRPRIMRLLFDYKWWQPARGSPTRDADRLQMLVDWIAFLQSLDCDVLIHPWGDQFAYSAWMLPPDDPHWWTHRDSRLPVPSARDAMVHSLADFVAYLRHDRQLTNVRYVCLMNEPDNDFRRPTPPDEFIRLTRLLAQCLQERGLDRDVRLLGPDDCAGQASGRSLWWNQTVPGTLDVLAGFSSHTYKHRDTRLLRPWLEDRLQHVRQLDPTGPARPLLVTEFGYVGLDSGTFDNPENAAYEYGLFMGDFAIEVLNARASAALVWCLFDQYYDAVHCQRYGLWQYKDQDWRPRPAFYSWSLVNRYTQRGSRVVAVAIAPPAEQVRGAATLSPDGRLTVMLVNRYDRDLQVELATGLSRPALLRMYRYTPAAIAGGSAAPLPASGDVPVTPGTPAALTLPAASFLLLTELP